MPEDDQVANRDGAQILCTKVLGMNRATGLRANTARVVVLVAMDGTVGASRTWAILCTDLCNFFRGQEVVVNPPISNNRRPAKAGLM
jgi:hypothetical protein